MVSYKNNDLNKNKNKTKMSNFVLRTYVTSKNISIGWLTD